MEVSRRDTGVAMLGLGLILTVLRCIEQTGLLTKGSLVMIVSVWAVEKGVAGRGMAGLWNWFFGS